LKLPDDRRAGPSLKPLAVLITVWLLLTGLLAYLLVSRDASPTTMRDLNPGPFRGNIIPDELRGARAPTFRLTDARGGSYGTADARGKPYVVTFLYTNCPDVCPLIGDELGQTLKLLGSRRDDVAVLAVSVDPKRDTAEAARAWLRRHRLPANFHYLIGEQRRLRSVWADYYAAPQVPGRPESAHTASIWLIDAKGRIATKYSGGFPVPPADMAHDLLLLLRARERTRSGATR